MEPVGSFAHLLPGDVTDKNHWQENRRMNKSEAEVFFFFLI